MVKNVIIVGGGIAGYTLAFELSKSEEFNITLVEKSDLGGVCLNKGCIPTKTMLYYSDKTNDLSQSIAKTKETISVQKESLNSLFKTKKVNLLKDEAKIESKTTIRLLNSNRLLNFDILILATGAITNVPSVFKNSNDLIISDDLLNIENTPNELVIVGGGYIGLEFATIFNQLGSKVSVIEKEERILTGFSCELSEYLKKAMEKKGIKFYLQKEIKKIEENIVYLEDYEILYDKILFAVGRLPNVINSNVNIKTEGGLIKVNDFFETSIQNIYCIGDSIKGPQLAHKAEYDAFMLAKNLINRIVEKSDYSALPFCVYCNPMACGININANYDRQVKVNFSALGKSYCDNSEEGFFKMYLKDEKIVGFEAVNKNALEINGMMSVIINRKMTCKEVLNIIFAHPTSSEIIKLAALKGIST